MDIVIAGCAKNAIIQLRQRTTNGGEERRGGIEIKSPADSREELARSKAEEMKEEEEKKERRKEIKENSRVREETIVWSQAG